MTVSTAATTTTTSLAIQTTSVSTRQSCDCALLCHIAHHHLQKQQCGSSQSLTASVSRKRVVMALVLVLELVHVNWPGVRRQQVAETATMRTTTTTTANSDMTENVHTSCLLENCWLMLSLIAYARTYPR